MTLKRSASPVPITRTNESRFSPLKKHAFTESDVALVEQTANLNGLNFKIYRNARAIWTSPKTKWVDDSDINNEGGLIPFLLILPKIGGGSIFWDEENQIDSIKYYWDHFDSAYVDLALMIERAGLKPPLTPRQAHRFRLNGKTSYAVYVGDNLSNVHLLDDDTNFFPLLDSLEPFESHLTEIAELAGLEGPDSAELVRALKAVLGIWLGQPLDAEGLAKVFAASATWQQEMPDLPTERFEPTGNEHILQFLNRVWKAYLYFGFADLNDLKKVDSEAFNLIPWPTVKFSEATGDLKSNVEKFLETYWKDLIAVGIATRRVIRDRDETLENGILNRQRKNKDLGPIPAEIRPATKEELNSRAAAAMRVPKRHQARLAGTQAGRLRAQLKNLTLHKT